MTPDQLNHTEASPIETPQPRRGWRTLGPGLLITAAFIGPGTVTKATVAGARYGYALMWAVAFSALATIVFQEMSARLGIVTQRGLGEALRKVFSTKETRIPSVTLVVAAIALGNAAYQTGNVVGAATGINALLGGGDVGQTTWCLSIGLAAMVVLWIGHYRAPQRVMIVMVVTMSCMFLLTAVIVRPDFAAVGRSILRPTMPSGSLADVIALIGTTVVPYNLFLHASSAAQQWRHAVSTETAIRQARIDTAISIALGGLVTAAIIITATSAFFGTGIEFSHLGQAAQQLEPTLGRLATYFFCLGLFAAGLTSSITAPLAAAYATAGCLGWSTDLRGYPIRAVMLLVLLTGTLFAAFSGQSPLAAIHWAQFANGLLLPFVAVFLLVVMNNSRLLGDHKNGWIANVLGAAAVMFVASLGIRNLAISMAGIFD